MKFDTTIQTSGTGLWSDVAKSVKILAIDVPYFNEEEDFGELQVYFDTDDWDVHKDGLIYTDDGAEEQLKVLLFAKGLSTDFDYSEQGMQGEDYISFDIGEEFIKSWKIVQK